MSAQFDRIVQEYARSAWAMRLNVQQAFDELFKKHDQLLIAWNHFAQQLFQAIFNLKKKWENFLFLFLTLDKSFTPLSKMFESVLTNFCLIVSNCSTSFSSTCCPLNTCMILIRLWMHSIASERTWMIGSVMRDTIRPRITPKLSKTGSFSF